ncbi:MAG: FAD/NAD(P)-binding protein [Planctomyces sp.]|nr:FAD/NAD(P)-binding protein [Planctomyces sp.]
MSNPWQLSSARIVEKTAETPGVATYVLQLTDDSLRRRFQFRPGQFNMLYVPGLGEAAISISGNPIQEGLIPHTIREAGNVTHAISSLSTGDTLGLRGPFGSSWPTELCEDRDVILVAGGIGLAPLRPVIFDMLSNRDRYRRCTVLMGARDPSGLLYESDYEDWKRRGVDVLVTSDRPADGWHGNVGVVTTLLDRLPLPDPASALLMTCGPEVMMWYTAQTAVARGIAEESIYVSLERNMNCAIGLCGHCQFGPHFLCKDGPVFRFDKVASILRISDL